ncbi:homeobox protein MSX-2 [Drosophila sechellia]|uniref:GM23140 n=1 Tax=Drosophila sechellia TaxID=7238 RepID=B4II64_DROSE|nr:homeobox protein MSX-2 [Drosophila sechellia]EDW49608.1 GM23140 [Drosophila sechellia]
MSDFSIEYILNRAGDRYVGTNASLGVLQRLRASLPFHPYAQPASYASKESGGSPPASAAEAQIPVYDWLQYTRYHPPKLPRALRQSAPAKRTPGRLPRIPFTPQQLQALESAYKESNYLSAEDANKLADSLELTNTRVKIWFQNRRARERREKREKDESCDSTFSSNASSPEPEMIVVT